MKKLFPKNFFLCLGLCCLFFTACKKESIQPTSEVDLTAYDLILKKELKNYQVFELDYDQIYSLVEENRTTGFKLNLNIPGKEHWDFQCAEDDLQQYFHPDYKYFHVDNGQLIEQELPQMLAIEAYSDRSHRSSFMTFALGRLEANIFDGAQEYQIDPLFNYSETAPKNWYVMYTPEDVIWEAISCDVKEESVEMESPAAAAARSTTCKVVEVTYLGDYELLSKWSSNQWVEAANWKSQRLYWANKRFYAYSSHPLMLQHKAGYQNVSSSDAQPNTNYNHSTFLSECADLYDLWWWNEGDVNHVWTGQNVSGVYGKAYSKQMCNPADAFCYAEHLSNNYQSNNLAAHEMGHVMGSSHDNSQYNVMNQSWSKVTNTLGPNAKTWLTNHMNANSSCFWTQTCQY